MQFIALMYPGEPAPSGGAPSTEVIGAMMKFNEELTYAGVLVALAGLQPPSTGAVISFAGGKPLVTDGPFVESKELLGGFWIINADSKEHAIELFKKCPAWGGERIELRQVFERADLGVDPESELGAQIERVDAAMELAKHSTGAS